MSKLIQILASIYGRKMPKFKRDKLADFVLSCKLPAELSCKTGYLSLLLWHTTKYNQIDRENYTGKYIGKRAT